MIACNTAHLFFDDLKESIQGDLISLVDSTIEHISNKGICRVHLIASPTTVKTRLYEDALISKRIHVVRPSLEKQHASENVIRAIIAGQLLDSKILKELISDVPEAGSVLLGCTELSVAFSNIDHVHIDPLDIVTNKILGV